MKPKLHPRHGPFSLNETSTFFYEIVRNGKVERTIRKSSDDENRQLAVDTVDRMNQVANRKRGAK